MNVANSYSGKSRWEKMGSLVQFPCSLLELSSLNCLKKVFFCNFVLTSVRNSFIKTIYIYAPERSRQTLSGATPFRKYQGLKLASASFLTFFQNSFSCGPPLGPFWPVKHLNLGQKLPIWQHEKFILCFFPEGSQISAHGLFSFVNQTYTTTLIWGICNFFLFCFQ